MTTQHPNFKDKFLAFIFKNLQWLLTLVIPLSVFGSLMGVGMRIGIWVFSHQYPSGYFINLSNKKRLGNTKSF
ncbi:Uncharacterised protein [Moraxella caprae]|uniref:Uncharacterized protein n=1 Tax=Moraxella caprae TaxID=90240 RepID=A0A378R574_9GAMM|nr:hypothetical protein [Moraxella caprae]STZ09030.1 Uncharacterised protein [Moraxella caprae]